MNTASQLGTPSASRRRPVSRGLKLGLLLITLLFILLFLLPQLIKPTRLRDSLADQLSTALGQPVQIEALKLRLLPSPAVTLEQLSASLGDEPLARLQIGRLHAVLSWRALVQRELLVVRLDITDTQLNPVLVERLQALTEGLTAHSTAASSPVRLQQASATGLWWQHSDGRQFGPFSATAYWQSGPQPQQIDLWQADQQLSARFDFTAQAIQFHFQAQAWQPPWAAAPYFETLSATGAYRPARLEIDSAHGQLLGGQMTLSGLLDWQQTTQLQLQVRSQQLDLAQLTNKLGQPPLAGQLSGDCTITAHRDTPQQGWNYPNLDCRWQPTLSGKATRIELRTQARAAGLDYQLQAQQLQLPMEPALQFDKLSLTGHIKGQQMRVDTLQLQAYAGQLQAQGTLSWAQDWTVDFKAQGKELALEPLLQAFNQRALDGRLQANCEGRLRAAHAADLTQQARLNCRFDIRDGVLYNTDLEQAARLFKGTSDAAGSTPFQRLQGQLYIAQGQTQLERILIHSSVLEAAGQLKVDHAGQLAGEMNVGLKNTAGVVSVPLAVAGTVDSPSLRPTQAALAGGAAGTLLLGPGLGTALGIKAGEAVQSFSRWLKPGQQPDATR